MTKTILFSVIIIGLIFFLSSCKTYYIPLDSFKQQFAGIDTAKLKEVTTRGPMGDKVKYKTFPIDFIKCVDKNGNPIELQNSPSFSIAGNVRALCRCGIRIPSARTNARLFAKDKY